MLPIGFCLILSSVAEGSIPKATMSEAIHAHELRAHVEKLSSLEFAGRRGSGAARTSRHLAESFKSLGLKPAFGDSYFQPIPTGYKKSASGFVGRNVGACLPGSDPALTDEWIIVSAHFDHLGIVKNVLYPGANDNASGVALMLEIAEKLVLSKTKPRRSVYFVGFDQEEYGLLGSRHLAQNPPLGRDMKKLKAFLTADMVGRSLHGLTNEYLFVFGCESAGYFQKLLNEIPPGDGLKTARMGADIIGTRSDYGPFRDRKVPFLFLTTGEFAEYHKPSDTPDQLDYRKLTHISRYVAALTERLANDDESPKWRGQLHREEDLDEPRIIHTILDRALEDTNQFQFNEFQMNLIRTARARLADQLKRGRMTAQERKWLVRMCRLVMVAMRKR